MTAPKNLAAGLAIIVASCTAGRPLPTPLRRRRPPAAVHGTKWHLAAKGPVSSLVESERIARPEDRIA